MDTDQLPTIDGQPYNLTPDFTFKSPFVNAEWPASKVFIEKDGRNLTLDFDLDLRGNGQWIDTGNWLGWLYDTGTPWFFSESLNKYIFLPDGPSGETGGWIYLPDHP